MGLLRFFLAVSVVISHSKPIFGITMVGGQVAVQAFYIISGFYMALILNEKYINKNGSYKLFLSNRLLRLFPVYWVILFMTIIYSVFAYTYYNEGTLYYYAEYYNQMNVGSFVFLVFTNIFLIFQDLVMFLGLNTETGYLFFTENFKQTSPRLHNFLFIPQAWTIGLEIAFYLIAPFLVRRKISVIFTIIILCLLLRAFLYYNYGLHGDPWSYRFFPTELVFFLLGVVSYHIYLQLNKKEIKTFYLKIFWLFVLAFTFLYSFLPTELKYYLYIFTFFISLPFIFILTKNWKYDRYWGELSYPIYVSHILVLSCISMLEIRGEVVYLVLLTVLFSIILNELVIKKVEKIRQKRVSK